jgi:hypothetical protein
LPLLEDAYTNPQNSIRIKTNSFGLWLMKGFQFLRKALILKTQKNQDVESVFKLVYVFNRKNLIKLLFKKSHLQTQSESLTNIVNLGQLAIEDGNEEAAKEILGFVLQNTQDLELLIQANSYLVTMKRSNRKDFAAISTELDGMLKQFETTPFTLSYS